MTWAQRLKRVFNIDIETYRECGGAVKIIACIKDPVVIAKILTHLEEKAVSAGKGLLPESRAPPQTGLYKKTHHSNRSLRDNPLVVEKTLVIQ